VRTGLRAKLANQGLTGVGCISTRLFCRRTSTRRKPCLVAGRGLHSFRASTFAQVQDMVTQLLTGLDKIDFAGMLRNVNGLVDDLRPRPRRGRRRAIRARASASHHCGCAKPHRCGRHSRAVRAGAPYREAFGPARPGRADTRRDRRPVPPRATGQIDGQSSQTSEPPCDTGLSDTEAELTPILRDLRAAMQTCAKPPRRNPAATRQRTAARRRRHGTMPDDAAHAALC